MTNAYGKQSSNGQPFSAKNCQLDCPHTVDMGVAWLWLTTLFCIQHMSHSGL